MIVLFFTVAIAIAAGKSLPDQGCAVSIRDVKVTPMNVLPLIVNGTKSPTFLYPDTKGILYVPFNHSITLACPGEANYLLNVTRLPWIGSALCVGKDKFKVKDRMLPFSRLRCKYFPRYELRRSGKCADNFLKLEIGYDLLEYNFLKVMDICYDDLTYGTIYTHFRMNKNIAGQQFGHSRPQWSAGKFYSRYNMNFLYRRDTQLETMKTIVGSEELAEYYVDYENNYFLARGHLAANRDFVYASEQMATFWYPNSAPQWQVFNMYNWMYLEICIRNFASRRRLDLDVYTGVFGQTSLVDERNFSQPLYLNVDGNDRGLTVPRFFWKVIYDPVSRRGTAFVGLNEPHAKRIEDDMYLCKDIGSRKDFPWLTWYPNDIQFGVSYVCAIDDLRKAVPVIPKFQLTGVLS